MTLAQTFLLSLGLLSAARSQSDLSTPTPQLWDSCFWVEGKFGGCAIDNQSRPFQEFLQPELMASDKHSGISSELTWDIHHVASTKTRWNELGELGGHRIRRIEYIDGAEQPSEDARQFAGFVVLERSPGLFFPLFLWCGSAMPESNIFAVGDTSVLVMARNFGGNIPMVTTWAWVWTAKGPLRIEVEKALQGAITKVAPGHFGYSTGLDRTQLHARTAT